MNRPSTPLHIVHVITGLGQGGAEAMLEKLVLAARQHSPDVTQEIISLRDLGDIGPRLLAEGVRVRALGLVGASSAPGAFLRLVRWLRDLPRTTVVQTWMYHADLIGGLAARLAGKSAIVWNVRQTGLELRDIGRATRMVVRACAWDSHHVPARIVCNAQAAIAAHGAVGYATVRFQVIANGFDTTRFSRQLHARAVIRQRWKLDDKHLAIGLVARLDPQKDHRNFILAAKEVARALPCARFVLVGRGIPESAELTQCIEENGLTDRFVREGQQQDIPAIMSGLDIFCLSSRAEGFPNVLGEAMACETPSVSTDVGDARMLLVDPHCLAPAENSQALATALLAMARTSPTERLAIAAGQRQRIVAAFGIASIWTQYLSLYRTL